MDKVVLKGITWDHSRGMVPLQAAAQRYSELHPGVALHWDKRSLQAFADYSIETLATAYDLLIIDHPWVGSAAVTGCVASLNDYISEDFLALLDANSAGVSHGSYNYDGRQWALAIDAATPVASIRADLFTANDLAVPQTWEEVLTLAKKGKVAAPAIPIDLLMNFYTFCIAQGEEPFDGNAVVSEAAGTRALDTMREFYAMLNPACFSMNPIRVAEAMSNTDEYFYCPFAYGYSNYSRRQYSKNILTYIDVVAFSNKPLQTTLGGTGIAVAEGSLHKTVAADFVQFVCSPGWQASEYILSGGQPGYTFGYTDPLNNQICNGFFRNTRATLNNAYLRPRYHGYLQFQDEGGFYVQEFLKGNIQSAALVLNKLNLLYSESLQKSDKNQ
ncbi:MAG: extracellular solute-binding protein [Niabella sp.]|nr:extracellular solute-binding protein [Niabella sp.]